VVGLGSVKLGDSRKEATAMHVLIVDDDIARQTDLTIAFIEAGFQPTATTCQIIAEREIRRGWVDVVVMAERVEGRLTHGLALLAEWRNPVVTTTLLTPRLGEDVEELFLLIPSLHCLLSCDTDADLVARLAMASVTGRPSRRKPMLLSPALRTEEAVDAIPIFASTRRPASLPQAIRRSA